MRINTIYSPILSGISFLGYRFLQNIDYNENFIESFIKLYIFFTITFIEFFIYCYSHYKEDIIRYNIYGAIFTVFLFFLYNFS